MIVRGRETAFSPYLSLLLFRTLRGTGTKVVVVGVSLPVSSPTLLCVPVLLLPSPMGVRGLKGEGRWVYELPYSFRSLSVRSFGTLFPGVG